MYTIESLSGGISPVSRSTPTMDGALLLEHFELLNTKALRLAQGDTQGGFLWGCEILPMSAPCWLPDILALHQSVRASLSDANKHLLLERTPCYFEKLLAGKTGTIYGAFIGPDLVGMAGALRHESAAAAAEANNLTCPPDILDAATPHKTKSAVILQSLCVHPDFSGRRVAGFLIDKVVAEAKTTGAEVFAQISSANSRSWKPFLHQGFSLVGYWKNGHSRFLTRFCDGPFPEATEKHGFAGLSNNDLFLESFLGAALQEGKRVWLEGGKQAPQHLAFG